MILRTVYGKSESIGIELNENSIQITEKKPEELEELVYEGKKIFWNQKTSYSKEDDSYSVRRILAEGPITGFGDKVGTMNRRQKKYTFRNTDNFLHSPEADPLYKSFPFYILLHRDYCAGFFADFPGLLQMDLDSEGDGTIICKAKGSGFTEYIFLEKNVEEVLKDYLKITGKNTAMPIWAFGYQQSRWGDINQRDFLSLADKFREKNFPCDVLYLDIDHMDGYKVFTWNKEKFPSPEKMFERLKKMGFKVSAIIDPGVKTEKGYKVFEEGKEKYFLKANTGEKKDFEGSVWPGRVRFPDFLSEEARKWWGNNVAEWKSFGFDGFWNDMNEISVFFTDEDLEEMKKELPEINLDSGIGGTIKISAFSSTGKKGREKEIVHLDGKLHGEVKNLYGREMQRSAYEGILEKEPEKRPFLISRSAYSGIQKYGGVWTGDNSSWWEHILLEMIRVPANGLCGVFYSGCDVGGFGSDTSPDMLVRFMQLGIFMPMFRNHAAWNTHQQEPWAFGEKYEKIMKENVLLRYKYLPSIYTSYMTGVIDDKPLVRPLYYDFYKDKKTWNIEDQFMLGDSILVAPVYRPSITERAVYLPVSGVELNTGKIYPAGWNIVPAPLERIPHFLLEGRGIITADPGNYIFEKKIEKYDVLLFGDTAKTSLYEDDGETFGYKKGEYSLKEISFQKNMFTVENIKDGFEKIKIKLHIKRLSPNGERTEKVI